MSKRLRKRERRKCWARLEQQSSKSFTFSPHADRQLNHRHPQSCTAGFCSALDHQVCTDKPQGNLWEQDQRGAPRHVARSLAQVVQGRIQKTRKGRYGHLPSCPDQRSARDREDNGGALSSKASGLRCGRDECVGHEEQEAHSGEHVHDSPIYEADRCVIGQNGINIDNASLDGWFSGQGAKVSSTVQE